MLQTEFEQRPTGDIDLVASHDQGGSASGGSTDRRSSSSVSTDRTDYCSKTSSTCGASRGSTESIAALNAIAAQGGVGQDNAAVGQPANDQFAVNYTVIAQK